MQVSIRPTGYKAFNGKAITTKAKLVDQELQGVTRSVVVQHLKRMGFKDVEAGPGDIIFADHRVIELRSGSVSNTAAQQHWNSAPGPEAQQLAEWAEAASPDKANGARDAIAAKTLGDLQAAVKWHEEFRGSRITFVTMGAIINPDTRHVDLYRFEGGTQSIGWMAPQAKAGFVRSYRY